MLAGPTASYTPIYAVAASELVGTQNGVISPEQQANSDGERTSQNQQIETNEYRIIWCSVTVSIGIKWCTV